MNKNIWAFVIVAISIAISGMLLVDAQSEKENTTENLEPVVNEFSGSCNGGCQGKEAGQCSGAGSCGGSCGVKSCGCSA